MTSNRKDDHVRYAVDQQHRGDNANDFDAIGFLHHALAGIDYDDVALTTEVAGKPWATPLFINAMTGGSNNTGEINRQLAVAARETGIPIACGSMSAYLRDQTLGDTYRVLRQENPHGIVIANINANTSVENAQRVIELVQADALQIHLNAVQEIVMPEGDRSFGAWPGQVRRIASAAGVPVIVKEVGFGLSRKTIDLLRDAGVSAADVSGRGGTNFARIENARRTGSDYSFIEGWGQSTPCCLLDVPELCEIDILASGGIRSPLDVARALALGAAAVGVSGRFLGTLVEAGTTALIDMIRDWLEQLRQIMTVLGAATPTDLAHCDLLITGEVASYCRLRGIDAHAYTNRSAGVGS